MEKTLLNSKGVLLNLNGHEVGGLFQICKENGIDYRTTQGCWFDHEEVFSMKPKNLDELIASKSKYFKECIQEEMVLKLYREMVVDRSIYINGPPRATGLRATVLRNFKKLLSKMV